MSFRPWSSRWPSFRTAFSPPVSVAPTTPRGDAVVALLGALRRGAVRSPRCVPEGSWFPSGFSCWRWGSRRLASVPPCVLASTKKPLVTAHLSPSSASVPSGSAPVWRASRFVFRTCLRLASSSRRSRFPWTPPEPPKTSLSWAGSSRRRGTWSNSGTRYEPWLGAFREAGLPLAQAPGSASRGCGLAGNTRMSPPPPREFLRSVGPRAGR